jgi:hypothetical protein
MKKTKAKKTDARWLFGRLEFRIRPSGGTGETWAQGVVLP